MLPNYAWEIQSVIQTEAASSARLDRVQDKNHSHNKLTNISPGQAYETTTVEVAEDTLEQASEEALNIVKKSTKNYHVNGDGTVVIQDDQTSPASADDPSQMGAHSLPPPPYPGLPQQNLMCQENPATDKHSCLSRTSVTSIASLKAGDIEQRLVSKGIEATTDCVIDTVEEEQEVLEVMRSFKIAVKNSDEKSIKERHLEMKERLEALAHQRDLIRLDLDAAGASSEALPEDLALIQNLGLLERRNSLARFAERLTTTANRVLGTMGSGPMSMNTTYKYLLTTTANDHLNARMSILTNMGETGTRAKTLKREDPAPHQHSHSTLSHLPQHQPSAPPPPHRGQTDPNGFEEPCTARGTMIKFDKIEQGVERSKRDLLSIQDKMTNLSSNDLPRLDQYSSDQTNKIENSFKETEKSWLSYVSMASPPDWKSYTANNCKR